MDPREAEFLLKYFTDLNKIDIPINVKDNSFGGRLSRLGSRIGTPVKNFINRKASIPNLLTPRSSTIPSPWGGSLTSSPVVNTLGGEVVDVAASAPKSFLGRIRSLPSGVVNQFAGNPIAQRLITGANTPVMRKVGGPVFAGTLGTTTDLAEGMSPVQAFGRNIAGTTAGVFAYPFGEGLLPMVPGSGIPAYIAADQLGRRGFDRLYNVFDKDSIEPTVVGVDDLPNDYQPLPTHIEENRGPEHLITGKGPSHLTDAVDKFLTDREEWEQRTQNSPARRSGAFTDDELWALQQKHRERKESRGR